MAYGPFTKYPDEVFDLPTIDWTDALDGKIIVTSDWTATTGITITGDAKTNTATTVRISGGTAGVTYTLQNTVTWDDGQTRIVELTVEVLTDDVP